MKILWLSNNPCYAIEKLSPETQSGGWLKALNYHIVEQNDIELSICFYWPNTLEPFEYHKTKYYPVTASKPNSLREKIARRVVGDTNEKENIKKLLDVVNEVKPDIIHVHGTELNFGLIQNQTSIPVVISIQGLLSPYYEKYFSGIPEKYLKRSKRISYRNIFRSLNNSFRINAIRERRILKKARYIIGRTSWDKRITGLLAPDRTYFSGNEILRDSFYREKNVWKKTSFNTPLTLITTSGNVAYKGFELIVKTADILNRYGVQVEWLVVGLDQKDNVVQAVKHWLKIDLKKIGIKFLGTLNEKQLIEALLRSDIYCQVSHIENSPNSLCEAMMLGMPIVATNVGGTSSMLKSDYEGILTQEGEPYDMAGAIVTLQNDLEKAKKYGDNARKTALSRHDPEQVVDEITSVYNTILSQNK